MAAAFQQQIFALDARFNAYRAPNNPNFKTLYIRRRSQLLRENSKFKDIETIKKYINVRSQLLQRRYGVQDNVSISSSNSRPRSSSKASINVDEFANSNAKNKDELSISENYAFSGVHHIFDQHSQRVSVVKFANNDRSLLCCAAADGVVSVCDVTARPPYVCLRLEGHSAPVTDCDWSASNELLVTCGLDGYLCLWTVSKPRSGTSDISGVSGTPGITRTTGISGNLGITGASGVSGTSGISRRLRSVRDQLGAPLLCCCFQPANNNMVIAGNARGMVEVLNVSTGIYPKGGSSILGGRVTAIACESSGRMFWAGNDKGVIVSYRVEGSGALRKLRRVGTGGAVSCLSWSPWLAKRPAVLASAADNSLYLFTVVDRDGALALRRRFINPQRGGGVRSTFCPIMSFGRGVCVATGADDACVYFLAVEGREERPVVNKLQGHASPVLGVSFSYDESLLATSDESGLVIVWRRSGTAPPPPLSTDD